MHSELNMRLFALHFKYYLLLGLVYSTYASFIKHTRGVIFYTCPPLSENFLNSWNCNNYNLNDYAFYIYF
ncbi:MAG: hypothetical protein BAJALOKI1v1_420016 [Promethearchaeota archaeon]|nr:MAG: hypothetical protein BAJALOKI1v1_420016 [Candidatus Lokiarchaeota archaeon]